MHVACIRIFNDVFLFPCAGSDEDDDGAAVLEFENALNFWREYIIESELSEKHPEHVASLDTFKRVLQPFLDQGKIRFTGCKGFALNLFDRMIYLMHDKQSKY